MKQSPLSHFLIITLFLQSAQLLSQTPTLQLNAELYTEHERVEILFNGFPVQGSNRVEIKPLQESPEQETEIRTTSTEASGRLRFSKLQPGIYVARAYFEGSDSVRAALEFPVALLRSKKTYYSYKEKIKVLFDYLPPVNYRITLTVYNEPDETLAEAQSTAGKMKGVLTFPGRKHSRDAQIRLLHATKPAVLARSRFRLKKPDTKIRGPLAGEHPIRVAFNSFPGNQKDWITLVPKNSAPDFYGEQLYTLGKEKGEIVFKGVAAGSYELRSFYEGETDIKIVKKIKISKPELEIDTPVFGANQPIVVEFDDTPGNPKDLVTVLKAAAADELFGEQLFTEGEKSGKLTFKGLPPGNYEARLYYENIPGVIVRKAILVAAPTLQMQRKVFTINEAIELNFSGLPNKIESYFRIASKVDPFEKYIYVQEVKNTVAGTLLFRGLPEGEYEARLLFDDNEKWMQAVDSFEVKYLEFFP